MANANLSRDALQKPPRGSGRLARKARRADLEKAISDAIADAKRRDRRCRWPVRHDCGDWLEGAHIKDKSTHPELADDSGNIVTVCARIPRLGPESIHGKQLRVETCGPDGSWGPLSFWKQTMFRGYYLVKLESAPFTYERD
jgi:hypothetical protein